MYNNIDECKLNYKKKLKYTNPKYPKLKLLSKMILNPQQLDEFFKNYKVIDKNNNKEEEITLNKDLIKFLNIKINNKLFKINNDIFRTTFYYLFFKTLTGIYVRIENNKLNDFIFFYNEDYKNDWGKNIDISNYYKNNKRYLDINKWSVNNCLVDNLDIKKYDNMIYNRLLEFKYYIKLICKNYKIKNTEFFINRRDFPVLRNDLKHPYTHVYKETINEKNFIPILSQCSSSNYADIPIPNIEDISYLTQKVYGPLCKEYSIFKETEWDKKLNIGFFRGNDTGCGNNVNTNQRLKVAEISYKLNDNNILDAGIVKYKYRTKIYNFKIVYNNKKQINIPSVNFVPMEEQLKYKYIIHIDGHSAAYRLLKELNYGSVILKVESYEGYYMWFSSLLIPYKHYVPIKKDLSDLLERLKWCRTHDDKCKEIAENAKKLCNEVLTLKTMLKYGAYIFNNL